MIKEEKREKTKQPESSTSTWKHRVGASVDLPVLGLSARFCQL